jgi:hypothetical protein
MFISKIWLLTEQIEFSTRTGWLWASLWGPQVGMFYSVRLYKLVSISRVGQTPLNILFNLIPVGHKPGVPRVSTEAYTWVCKFYFFVFGLFNCACKSLRSQPWCLSFLGSKPPGFCQNEVEQWGVFFKNSQLSRHQLGVQQFSLVLTPST